MYSSNIVMARLRNAYLQNGDLYGYAKLFGFGAKTGVGLPGESAGLVPPIERWSARTRATMAFDRKWRSTPLQLRKYAAIANGRVMMPRLVKAVADPRTGEVMESRACRGAARGLGKHRAHAARVLSPGGGEGTAQAAKSVHARGRQTGTRRKQDAAAILANKVRFELRRLCAVRSAAHRVPSDDR